MRTQGWTVAMVLGLGWWMTGCGSGEAKGMEAEAAPPEDAAVVDDAGNMGRSSFVEREFWLALAEEPTWHLNVARDDFMAGKDEQASQEMAKVAAILNFESRHAHSPREEGLLLGSVEELREVARQLRFNEVPYERVISIEELDRTSALAFRTIAEHQVALARDALAEGDGRMAGRYIAETANALESGFLRADIPLGKVIPSQLKRARQVASQLELDGDGSMKEALASLDDLDAGVAELGSVITGGRK